MVNVTLRPDLKTAGGEVLDIVVGGKYAGSLSIVYREGDRISGTVLIDRQAVSRKKKEPIVRSVRSYMEQMVGALNAPDCEVIVAYGDYDHIIASEENIEVIEEFLEEPPKKKPIFQHHRFKPSRPINRRMRSDKGPRAVEYELVVVDEKRNGIEYHVYDERQRLVAEVSLHIFGFDVDGEIHWHISPTDEDIEQVMALIISDFDENEVDSFMIDMIYDGEVIDSIEMMHEDLLDEPDSGSRGKEEYSEVQQK